MIDIRAGGGVIRIGRVQENEYRRVVFDVADVLRDYPAAVFTVMNQRIQDTEAYPVPSAQLSVEGGTLYWTLKAGDLAYEGVGRCEVIARSGSVVAKSAVWSVWVEEALDGDAEPPAPWEGWVEQVTEAAELLENPGAEAVTLEPGSEATASYSEGTFTFGIPSGLKGDPGEDGQDGYSPTASVSKAGDTVTITVTDISGTTTATVSDGKDGADGKDGVDGFSPVASVSKSGSTATITITDKTGTTTAQVSDGQDGADGYTPTASVSKSGSTATISITDKNGTTTATVSDGANGQDGAPGQDGYTPVRGTDYWTAEDQAVIISAVEEDVGDEISELKSEITPLIVNAQNLQQYFYKANIYINSSGVETTLNGYDTYKIPCKAGQIIRISWAELSEAPWQGIDVSYAWKIFKSDDTFIQIKAQSSNNGYVFVNNKEGIAICPADAVYSTLTVKHGNETGVSIQIDIPYETANAYDKVSFNNVVHIINESNAIKTQFYFNQTTQTFSVMGASIKVLMLRIHSGDMLDFTTIRAGVSTRAGFRADDGAMTNIGTVIGSTFIYTAESDGTLAVYYTASEIGDALYKPKDQIKIEAKNVIGLSDGTQFVGLSGVAFGTSLTYRKVSGNGYLTFLEPLSGITFDNQGIGSSTILGNGGSLDMLAAIKAYASYSGKSVCLLEGFVNDWYGNKPLGAWDDSEETTVCGCVRSALNYMLSQNANMTVFLILDHYGRNYNTLDCSTTAKNGSGITQYEYYSEIAKVAESLGMPVIKEYEISQISENTPQYLADNIHCNVLGATQSGNAIWNQMKQYPLNANQ